jgi:hypothetical protein
MPEPATPRLGIPRYLDSEEAKFAAQTSAISNAVDAHTVVFAEGTAAARPAAGVKGRIYFATDTKIYSFDNAAEWQTLGALLLRSWGVGTEVHPGEMIEATSGITVTLPAPAINVTVAVFAKTGETTIKQHTLGGDTISGDFVSGAATIKLAEGQHVTLTSNGIGWFIVAGEPKREQTLSAIKNYTKAEMEAGIEFSATRLVWARAEAEITGVEIGGTVTSILSSGQSIMATWAKGQSQQHRLVPSTDALDRCRTPQTTQRVGRTSAQRKTSSRLPTHRRGQTSALTGGRAGASCMRPKLATANE